MSKLKKLLPKRDLRARWLWVLALALTAVKLGLCSFQLIVASPDLSPIDDTLMFNLAKSISAGNWLGEYDWLTLGKHSFYALWLAFLNLLHVNIVVGGQALFAVSCLVLLAALFVASIRDKQQLVRALPLLLCTLMTPVWFIVLRTHSIQHGWFTWRALGLTIFAGTAFLYYCCDIRAAGRRILHRGK